MYPGKGKSGMLCIPIAGVKALTNSVEGGSWANSCDVNFEDVNFVGQDKDDGELDAEQLEEEVEELDEDDLVLEDFAPPVGQTRKEPPVGWASADPKGIA